MVHAAYSFISVARTCTNIVSLCGEKEHLFIPSGTKGKTFKSAVRQIIKSALCVRPSPLLA